MRFKALTLAVCSTATIAVLQFAVLQFANAQDIRPMASPYAEVTQRIGTTDVKVVYHRPSVKERTVWGELVPYGGDKPWRTGANNSTEITFSKDVSIEGKELPAGTYTFYAFVEKDEWTLILNKKTGTWGNGSYDPKEDALRVTVKPKEASHAEQLTYGFDDVTLESAIAFLHWEKLKVPFKIEAK